MQVLIIDTSIEIIQRYKELLSQVPGIKLIYEASNYEDAILYIATFHFEVVLLDINLPGGQSLELVKRIKSDFKKTKIIATTNRIDDQMINQFRINGVAHFIDKYNEFEKIPDVIQSFMDKQ
jgi:DNA-binding NarL/FixJ family response regulator